jgi:hypothetical protein
MKTRLSSVLLLSAQQRNIRWNENVVPRFLKLSNKLEAKDQINALAALTHEIKLPDIR